MTVGCFLFKRRMDTRGFSMVELLTVLAIISLLVTLTAASLGTADGRSVANAVNIVSNSVSAARQTAISKGKPVAFVLSRSTGGIDPQAVIFLMFNGVDGSGNNIWTPMSGWTPVSARVAVAVVSASFYPGGTGVISVLPATLKGVVPSYDYVVFQPDGGVDAPALGPSLTFTKLNKSNATVDYTLVLRTDSGRSKIF